MKLVKINNIRAGQIWKNAGHDLILIESFDEKQDLLELKNFNYDFHITTNFSTNKNYLMLDTWCSYVLIGFLGITHKIEEGTLVEIPREELNLDDIVQFYNDPPRLLTMELMQQMNSSRGLNGWSRKGILGVNYEFVHNNLM